jgi:hypothetical protein
MTVFQSENARWDEMMRPKRYGGTGIRARVKRITTAYANHYTIPPQYGSIGVPVHSHHQIDSSSLKEMLHAGLEPATFGS